MADIDAPNIETAARAYPDAWHRKDAAAIGAHLHPDVTFKSPMASAAGREARTGG
jgi:ketosteroid isomerase-like protein